MVENSKLDDNPINRLAFVALSTEEFHDFRLGKIQKIDGDTSELLGRLGLDAEDFENLVKGKPSQFDGEGAEQRPLAHLILDYFDEIGRSNQAMANEVEAELHNGTLSGVLVRPPQPLCKRLRRTGR